MILQLQVQVMVDHTDTTVSPHTTGTHTSLDVMLTSIYQMDSPSNTSELNTMVQIQRTVFTSEEWVTCT